MKEIIQSMRLLKNLDSFTFIGGFDHVHKETLEELIDMIKRKDYSHFKALRIDPIGYLIQKGLDDLDNALSRFRDLY